MASDDDYMDDANSEEDAQFEYESDIDIEVPVSEQPARPEATGPTPIPIRQTSRQKYHADATSIVEMYAGTDHSVIQNLMQTEDSIEFTIVLPSCTPTLVLMVPDQSGYPSKHEIHCLAVTSVPLDIESVLGEVARLPITAPRSLPGIIEYLILRLIKQEPSPYFDIDRADSEDDLDFEDTGLGTMKRETAIAALHKQFSRIVKAGYRPGLGKIDDLEVIISISHRIVDLHVPPLALQAWDSLLVSPGLQYLVLLIKMPHYPLLSPNDFCKVKFKIGLSNAYKPSKTAMENAFRIHGPNGYTENDFQCFSLSKPMELLFNSNFGKLLIFRMEYPYLGWAAAENHSFKHDIDPIVDARQGEEADRAYEKQSKGYKMPAEPPLELDTESVDYPLAAFSYLLRRFVACPLYCLVCYKTINTHIIALKPFVCDSSLCLFQLFTLNLGPSIEHEILVNAPVVDLLIQLAYIAAVEGGLGTDKQPLGLNLHVPLPDHSKSYAQSTKDSKVVTKYAEYDAEYDSLSDQDRQTGLAALINKIPSVTAMRNWLNGADLTEGERALQQNRYRRLSDIDEGKVPPSAWTVLSWIIASNTSYLKLIEEEDELVQGIPKAFRQFRLIVGAPAKEYLLRESIKKAQETNENSNTYPTLYGWHGSSTSNWTSILREGLHFKSVTNGRAFGHGVYFALDGLMSFETYSRGARSNWKNSGFRVSKLAALCEIVNLPDKFVSQNPHIVCDQLDWIQARYLIVPDANSQDEDELVKAPENALTAPVPLDPKFPIRLGNNTLVIPNLLPKLRALREKIIQSDEDYSVSDYELCWDDSQDQDRPGKRTKFEDIFVPCGQDILEHVRILPPPRKPNIGTVRNINNEVKAILEEQKTFGPTKAGFYLDLDRSQDNLFTWILEIPRESFDESLPLVKDMALNRVTSLLFEIRFSEAFPLTPPFFRIVYPRFLSFAQGGGGHVTGGGSICMDLLTSSGWSPVYTISAILLQIRMAISNLHPNPARLASNYNVPYTMSEAVAGFKRAADFHGWEVPKEFINLR